MLLPPSSPTTTLIPPHLESLAPRFITTSPSHTHPPLAMYLSVQVFFLKAQYRGGGVSVNESQGLEDHMWLTKEEMKEYLSDDYYQSIASSLID